MDAGAVALDVPVDHHAGAAVAGVVFGHQVRVPGAEPLGVARDRGCVTPPALIAGAERRVDDADDRPTEVVAVDVRLAGAPQRVLALAALVVGGDLRDPHVRPEREQRQQQPAADALARNDLARRDRGQLVGEAGQVIGLLEHVEQVHDTPAADDLPLDRGQRRGLGLLAQFRDADPYVSLAGRDPHPARGAVPQRAGEADERLVEVAAELVDERG